MMDKAAEKKISGAAACENSRVKETGINGVKVVKSLDEITDVSQKILGGTLVTIQTGEAGKVVNKILIAQDMYYDGPTERKEFYLSILLDRAKGENVIIIWN